MKPYLRKDGSDVILSVRIMPGASKTKIVGELGFELKLRVSAIAEHGKANHALLRYLSDLLKIPVARIQILAGELGRRKKIRITNIDAAVLESRIEPSRKKKARLVT